MGTYNTKRNSSGRRDFLRLRWRSRHPPLRPPWSCPPESFAARCTRCSACIQACPAHVLRAGDAGLPEIDFERGACTFCGACAEACTSGALQPARRNERPWQLIARIDSSCLALNRIECRVCGERCEAGAIRFELRPGAVAAPRVSAERCTGCGACIADCPAHAIDVDQPSLEAQTA